MPHAPDRAHRAANEQANRRATKRHPHRRLVATHFDAFRAKDKLDAMRRSAMARSFSWDLPAACYSALYRKTIAPSIIA